MRRSALALCVLLAAFVAPRASAVIGGSPADPQYTKYVAALVDGNDLVFCGGTVIAPDWVLTAAHCATAMFAAAEVRPPFHVVVGRNDLRDRSTGQVRRISETLVYPGYIADNLQGDAALLHLEQPVTVQPVALAEPGDDGFEAPGADVATLGWGTVLPILPIGKTTIVYLPSKLLRRASLRVVSDAQCEAAYALTNGFLAPRVTPSQQVCAARILKDSCTGDSGGPLVADKNRAPVQVGIVSFGLLCAIPTHPGVYTEVNNPYIHHWITDTAGLT